MKKYQILHFPSLDGSPKYTNWLFIAYCHMILRQFNGAIETRIIDQRTKQHIAIW